MLKSRPGPTPIPSSSKGTQFLKQLAAALTQLGVSDVHQNTQSAYVIGTISSNIKEDVPTVGFISHVDTADFNAHHINPQVIEDYDSHSDIQLGISQYTLSPESFATLIKYKGHILITTDGTTLFTGG